ncbi:MAG: hypothetical protein Q9225_000054 [Loekoesia sp. 1 TL-2023]
MTATTALTAQDTQGVSDIHYIPSTFITKQIDACIDDIGVDVVKIGILLLFMESIQYTKRLSQPPRPDPDSKIQVMVATSGSQLLPNSAVTNLRQRLLPLTTILTPNIPEAKLLLTNAGIESIEIRSISDIVHIASLLQRLGPKYILIKGGHVPFDSDLKTAQDPRRRQFVIDVLHSGDGNNVTIFKTEYSESKNTHGTGCSLASAIASNLALGKDMPRAVEDACRYVERGIKTAPDLGKGSGPINHFHALEVKGQPVEESSSRREVWRG